MPRYYVQTTDAARDPDGPYTKRQIKQDLRDGRWTYDITVCLEGDARWLRLEDVPALASLLPGRSAWLVVSIGSIALASLGNVALFALVVRAALRDGQLTPTEITEILVFVLFALVWVLLAVGVYRRSVSAYLRARRWLILNLVVHALYILSGRYEALVSIPLEAFTLVALWLARRDFNLAA